MSRPQLMHLTRQALFQPYRDLVQSNKPVGIFHPPNSHPAFQRQYHRLFPHQFDALDKQVKHSSLRTNRCGRQPVQK